MWNNDQTEFFRFALFYVLGKEVKIKEVFFTSGGCINNTAQLNTDHGNFFIKWNELGRTEMFPAEAKSLQLLADQNVFKIPEVMGYGKFLNLDFLVMEYIQSKQPGTDFWEGFGKSLAELHSVSQPLHGLSFNNFIGKLPQKNTPQEKWIPFFIKNRLEVQIELSYYKGLIDQDFLKKFRNIYKHFYSILPEEKPALLHGDLWSGNFLPDELGKPALIDPAIYFGSREAEISYTKLFGGFEDDFYTSYHEAFPLVPGIEDRIEIYNLYPLLVHVNLFGLSYLGPIEKTMKKFQ